MLKQLSYILIPSLRIFIAGVVIASFLLVAGYVHLAVAKHKMSQLENLDNDFIRLVDKSNHLDLESVKKIDEYADVNPDIKKLPTYWLSRHNILTSLGEKNLSEKTIEGALVSLSPFHLYLFLDIVLAQDSIEDSIEKRFKTTSGEVVNLQACLKELENSYYEKYNLAFKEEASLLSEILFLNFVVFSEPSDYKCIDIKKLKES